MMATVAGGGGERTLLRRRRLPLGDLTNLSSSTSVLTRLKPAARSKPRTSPSACSSSSTSSIGSSTAPHTRCPPPPPRVAVVIKGKDKSTKELQSSTCHLKKSKMISKAKVRTGDMLPGASSPPSKKTRKLTREVLSHVEPLDKSSGEPLPCQDFMEEQRAYFAEINAFDKPMVKTGDVLSGASSPPSNKTRKVYQITREDQLEMEPLDQSSGERLPSQDFIEERRAYFAEVDAFELVEEFASSSGSDLE